MIAPFISREEYECPCCRKLPPDLNEPYASIYENLFFCFERWRKSWGQPIPILSGYRCPGHNAAVGGERDSVHMFGAALDCDFSTPEEVEQAFIVLVDMFPNLRIGKYTQTGSFIHMDTGYLIFPRLSEAWVHGARWYK